MNVTVKLSGKVPINLQQWPNQETVTLDLEKYLQYVVPSEIGNSSPIEAQKAQAVAARSYVVAAILEGATSVLDNSNFQVFKYAEDSKIQNSIDAVKATVGEVLYYDGKVAKAWYSATNNGQMKSAKEVWGSERPWTVSKPDPWDLAYRATHPKAGTKGHNVGMSQNGAMYAGSVGCSYKDILAFYYPGTEVKRWDGISTAAPAVVTSSKPKVQSLIEYAQNALNVGGGYVWGSQGETCTEALRTACARANCMSNGEVVKGKEGLYKMIMQTSAKWDGRQVWDCSGIFRGAANKFGIPKMRNGKGWSGATTIWSICCNAGKGEIKDGMPEVPGIALFRYDGPNNMGHIGLYVGDGDVIEAKGAAVGVVKTRRTDGKWTHWAYVPDYDYGIDIGIKDAPKRSTKALPKNTRWTGRVKTNRDGRIGLWKTVDKEDLVCYIYDGETVGALEDVQSGMVRAVYDGQEGYADATYLTEKEQYQAEPTKPSADAAQPSAAQQPPAQTAVKPSPTPQPTKDTSTKVDMATLATLLRQFASVAQGLAEWAEKNK